jgi:hypothetical protein
VDYVSADRVEGPWHDDSIEAGPRVLRTAWGRVLGPGHCSVVPGRDASTLVLVYHAWDAARTARRMCIDALALTPDGPRCTGPSWTEQRLNVPAPDGA